MFSTSAGEHERQFQQVVPMTATLTDFYVRSWMLSLDGGELAFVVRKNGADTSVACVVHDGETECSDTINSAAFSVGDLFSIQLVPINYPNTTEMWWTAKFTPTP